MRRRKPLERRSELKAKKPWTRKVPLADPERPTAELVELENGMTLRRMPLAPRSAKQTALYVARRLLVRRLLEERPWCEIQWDDRCQGRSVDADEIVLRSQGGSILDEANLQTACRACHDAKHAHPNAAEARGVYRRGTHGEAA
ncbi:HNH endonuclease [Allonocardiopsis opalescens]|uniref:HNH endonuclease n=1 Tax=Allonocardiopsis opalescens TaxID=1144618 RepID=A0A2T0PP38_9ACTN|nr:HNH endonuclease [Allonocardiopsis opalescens]PRX90670.1 HNH endonuclease [Allonocardiopsis opalescens]